MMNTAVSTTAPTTQRTPPINTVTVNSNHWGRPATVEDMAHPVVRSWPNIHNTPDVQTMSVGRKNRSILGPLGPGVRLTMSSIPRWGSSCCIQSRHLGA